MKKLFVVLGVVFLSVSLALAGCGGGGAAGPDGDEPLKVALLLSGPANDQGWNAIAVAGLVAAEEQYGIEASYMENLDIADVEAAYMDYASQGYDLIIGHGFQFGEPALAVSESFPDQYFMATESASQGTNMASYVMSAEEGGYLMGLLSASMTETGRIGVVGGFEQPSIVKEIEAFKVAARSVNPDIVVYSAFVNSWTDVTAGKAAAESMIDQGADVLYHVANQAGTGVIIAAEENGLLACGNSYDQNSIAPDTVLSSTEYNMPLVVLTAVENVLNGTFEGGIFYLGMSEGVVDISPYHGMADRIPQDVKDLIAQARQDIADGTLVVPRIETSTN